MLKALMEKVDNMQEKMGKIRGIETLRNKQMLEIKNTVTEIRNAFGGIISRVYRAKERISETEDGLIEMSQTDSLWTVAMVSCFNSAWTERGARPMPATCPDPAFHHLLTAHLDKPKAPTTAPAPTMTMSTSTLQVHQNYNLELYASCLSVRVLLL